MVGIISVVNELVFFSKPNHLEFILSTRSWTDLLPISDPCWYIVVNFGLEYSEIVLSPNPTTDSSSGILIPKPLAIFIEITPHKISAEIIASGLFFSINFRISTC